MADVKRPEGSAPDNRAVPTHAAPPSPRQSETQSQRSPQTSQGQRRDTYVPSDSQKSQIRDYFRSQGKQPEDVIMDLQGLQLRLKDLD
jgi:hypothetical protein